MGSRDSLSATIKPRRREKPRGEGPIRAIFRPFSPTTPPSDMKFKAKIIDVALVQSFSRLLVTVSKQAKRVVLKLTPSHLYLIVAEEQSNSPMKLWTEIPSESYFSEYRMLGVSLEENAIYLEFPCESLIKAIRSINQNSKSFLMKLSKKRVPCITLEIEQPSMGVRARNVTHDIPVDIISRKHWPAFEEPRFDDSNAPIVSIGLPSLKLFRNVVEKMKNLHHNILMSATAAQRNSDETDLSLKVETEGSAVSTLFNDLPPPAIECESGLEPSKEGEVRVDVKRLANFLNGFQTETQGMSLYLKNHSAARFILIEADIRVQFILPHMLN